MDLHFVSAPGGSAFMHELLTAVAHEVAQCIEGTAIDAVRVSEGPLTGADDDVFVVVPHEFFRVLPPDQHPSADRRRRTIGFCVEHPGTVTFTTTMRYAHELGACVDINDDSAFALRAAGVRVERFRLGYTSTWDHWGGRDSPRACDVLYLGTADDRRSRYLTMRPEVLAHYEVRLATPPHEPMTRPRPDFFMGDAKLNLLAQSRLLLNLHRESGRSFEWVRALEAISNGCVVVSEHSTDHGPLVAGEHFVAAAPHTVVDIARAVLEQPDREAMIRCQAYDFIRSELPMRTSAAALVDLAVGLDDPHHQPAVVIVPATRPWPSWPADRRIATVHTSADAELDDVRRGEVAPLPSWETTEPDRHARSIDAILLAFDGTVPDEPQIAQLLADLAEADDTTAQVIVAGTTELTANDALRSSDAEFVLVLESVDELVPGALRRLVEALDTPQADVAFGFVVTASGTFRSQWPFEHERVLQHDYLAAASLWRRSALVELGGWNVALATPRAATWDLRRRCGHAGGDPFHIPRPIAVQRPAQVRSTFPVVM
ncbi:MAG: glycosyltransferase [Actinomycetota bacterium]